MRQSYWWALGERLAPTALAYDAALGDSTVPTERYGHRGTHAGACRIESPEFLRTAAALVAAAISVHHRGPARPGPQRRRRALTRPLSSSRRRKPVMIKASAWSASGSSTSTRRATSTSTRSASTSTLTWCRTGSAGWWSTHPLSRKSRSCSSCRGRRRSRKASPSSFARWSPPATSGLAHWRPTTAGPPTVS